MTKSENLIIPYKKYGNNSLKDSIKTMDNSRNEQQLMIDKFGGDTHKIEQNTASVPQFYIPGNSTGPNNLNTISQKLNQTYVNSINNSKGDYVGGKYLKSKKNIFVRRCGCGIRCSVCGIKCRCYNRICNCAIMCLCGNRRSKNVKTSRSKKVKSKKVRSKNVKSKNVKSKKVKSKNVKSKKVKSKKVKSKKVKSKKVKK